MQHHKIGLWSLTFTGVGSIIGSGWLFSVYYAAKYAGVGAYIAWLIGAGLVLFLSLMLSEIVTLHPKRGLFTRLLTLSHDHDTGYITALANWMGMVAVIAAEAVATVQYISNIHPAWSPYLYSDAQAGLTTLGLLVSAALVLVFGLLNYWGAHLFAKSNNVLTCFKLIVPVMIAFAIIGASFHPHNFGHSHSHKLLPHGISSIFTAVMASGIVYAFNGFQAVASFSAEAKRPAKNIPRATFLAIVTCLLVYLLLQTVFIGGLPKSALSHGWSGLYFNSPIVDLALLLGLNMAALLAYVGACVGPSGAGLVLTGSSTRMLTAMSQEQQAPSFFNVIHPKYHFSRRSLIFNIFLAIVFVCFSRSWHDLSILVSVFHMTSYMACPLALMRLRIKEPHRLKSAYRMPFANIICPLFFLLITLLISLTPEKFLIIVAIIVVVFYLTYIVVHNQWQLINMWHSLQRSFVLPLYFVWLMLIGLLGNPRSGSFDILSHQAFYIILTISSLLFYYQIVYRYKQSPYFRH